MKTLWYKKKTLILGASLLMNTSLLMAKADGSETNNGDSHKKIPLEFLKQSPEFILDNREFLDRFPTFQTFIQELSNANPYLSAFFWNDIVTATILTTDANLKLVPDSQGIIDEEAPDAGYGRRYEDFILFNVENLSTLKPYQENPEDNVASEPAVGLVHESLHSLIQQSSPKEVHKMLVGSFNKALFKNRSRWNEKIIATLLGGLKDKISKKYTTLSSTSTPRNALTLLIKLEAEQELRCLIYDLGGATLNHYGDYSECDQWRRKWEEEASAYGFDKDADTRLATFFKRHPGLYLFKNSKYPSVTVEAVYITDLCRVSETKHITGAGTALSNIENVIHCERELPFLLKSNDTTPSAVKRKVLSENCAIYPKRKLLEDNKDKVMTLKNELENLAPQTLSEAGPLSNPEEALNWIDRLSIQRLYDDYRDDRNHKEAQPITRINDRLEELNKEIATFDKLAKYCSLPSSKKKTPTTKKS